MLRDGETGRKHLDNDLETYFKTKAPAPRAAAAAAVAVPVQAADKPVVVAVAAMEG